MSQEQVKELLERFKALKEERAVWDNHFQVIGEYIHQNKQNFETTITPGEFLNEDIFDSTGTFAAVAAASSLLGLLWPGSAKNSIEIVPPDELDKNNTAQLADFYEMMTAKTVRAMDDPRANLNIALDEYMLDQVVFGTSGVGVEKGDKSKLMYTPYGVKELYIEEGKGGQVKEIWLCFEWRVGRVVDEYGVDKVSEKIRKKYNDGKVNEKVRILIAIKPRKEPKAKEGALSMPIESIHVEHDTKHLLKESGYHELPIPVGRFRKLNYERYGRSAGMMALPDIREANALREAIIVATEKVLDMPKGVFHDGVFGGGVIDTSAKAINVFNDTGVGTPIFDIGTPPKIEAALARIEDLKQSISQHFGIDRLLDFNNEQQMTLGEAQIRNQIRTASLQSLFARQIGELFTPLVERSVNILFRAGEFGVVPDSKMEQEAIEQGREVKPLPDILIERLEKGESIYEVRYKTQAAQASKEQDLLGIIETLNIAGQVAQLDPGVLKRMDMHEVLKEVASIRAIPANILRQDDEVEELERAEAEAAQAQSQLNQVEQASNIAKNVAPFVNESQQ